MAIPTVLSVSDRVYNSYFADISTASISCIPIMGRGRLKELSIVTNLAVTSADNVVTVKIGSTTTGQTLTTPSSGAAIGKNHTLTFTGNVMVDRGDVVILDSDGGGSAVVPATCTLVVGEGN